MDSSLRLNLKFLEEELKKLSVKNLKRSLRRHDDRPGRLISINGKSVINFSSNNYLGLANHASLCSASREALECGTGSGASRLVTGNLAVHEQLETELAEFHQMESVRIFNSGYQANIGLIASLAGKNDLIVSDKLNHASIIDGSKLSGAKVRIFDHCDPNSALACIQAHPGVDRVFLISESVFSMDGDRAPLLEYRKLCDTQGAFLIIDDVHGLSVIGPGGRGLCAELGVIPDALVGGMGKGFGSFGGYVAGSELLSEFLLHKARSFVFSTGLPAAVAAASLASLRLVRSTEGDNRRKHLNSNIEYLRQGLRSLGLLTPGSGSTAIFPIIIGDSLKTVEMTQKLLAEGVFCQAIRPPTVPEGKARLRISLSCLHTKHDIDRLLSSLSKYLTV